MRPAGALRLIAVLAVTAAAAAAELLVFQPSAVPTELQRILAADPALAGWTVAVASKHRVFQDGLLRHPDVVIAPSFLLGDAGWKPRLQGRAAGRDSIRWTLAAVDAGWAAKPASQLCVGLRQEFPREAAGSIVAAAFPGIRPFARQRLAARADDVLGLLGLELADAVILSPDMLEPARARFQTSLLIIAESVPIRLAVVFVPDGPPAPAVEAISRLAPATCQALGVDSFADFADAAPDWRAPREEG